MQMKKWLHQRIAWLALCAVLFAAIAPSVSHLLAAAGGKAWVDICSVYGPKRVELQIGSQKTHDIPSLMVHCPFCLLQNDLPFIPQSAGNSRFAPMRAESIVDHIALHTPQSRPAKTAHLTRAPPFIS